MCVVVVTITVFPIETQFFHQSKNQAGLTSVPPTTAITRYFPDLSLTHPAENPPASRQHPFAGSRTSTTLPAIQRALSETVSQFFFCSLRRVDICNLSCLSALHIHHG